MSVNRYGLHIICILLLVPSCRDGKRYHDAPVSDEKEVPAQGKRAVQLFQEALDKKFADPESSPLNQEQLRAFEGLAFFPADTTYQTWALLERSPEALPFEMPTTTDRMARERKYGTLYFELKGRPFSLEVYQSPDLMMQEGYEDYLFLPFTDSTNGSETYEGGRYIDLRIPLADSLLLDFNRAYNPYCVYNPEYSCPIVPAVNNLDIPIRAGVMVPPK
jgi:uncharacterized protein (DUF1684 family)